MVEGWLLTGVPAAGKSTVGALLAERLGLPFVECEAIHPGETGPSEKRYERVAALVPGAVVEDVVLGPWLEWLVERARPCRLVVLAPDRETVSWRNADRGKDGYGTWTVGQLDDGLRVETARLGLWIDNTAQTPEQTVAEILARADEALV